MKVAYYNPYLNSAENQIFISMRDAGRRIGLELAECKNDFEINNFDPDFVISVTSQVPKVTHHPAYLAMHEPKASIFLSDAKFKNILSYDGYLTVSDTLVRFIRDFTVGVGRSENPGFFYLTPQKIDLSVDWGRVTQSDSFKVAYFGTNWKARMPTLLKRLDAMGILRIHGPRAAWEGGNYASYQGPVDFDGVGPQKVYAACGSGLVLLDDKWREEDIVSNRIFEISSVGAISFCPDIPWSRKWFGDSVMYFDPSGAAEDIAARIAEGLEFCRSSPDSAREMAEGARKVFEETFAADRMLQHAVDYHAGKVSGVPARVAAVGPQAEISVIMRCGGRATDRVREAVSSITGQTFGKFHIVFAKYRNIDLSDICREIVTAGCSFEEFLIEGGGRATMLYEGLKRIRTEYFSVLDDDDLLMPDHFEHLFAAGRRMNPHFDVAFSGCMDIGVPVDLGAHTPSNRVISRFGYTAPVRGVWDLLRPIHVGSMVARNDLLTPALIEIPEMQTAEDSLLIGIVSRRTRPVFSYKPTFLYSAQSEDGSGWRAHPERQSDENSLAFRVGLSLAPAWVSDGLSISPTIQRLAAGDLGAQNASFGGVALGGAASLNQRGRAKWSEILRRPSILLGPIAPKWRAYKARRRAGRRGRD